MFMPFGFALFFLGKLVSEVFTFVIISVKSISAEYFAEFNSMEKRYFGEYHNSGFVSR